MYQDEQLTSVFLQPSCSNSNLLWVGVKLEGKTLGSRRAEHGPPKSHIFPAQFPTIRPRQLGVSTWGLFGTAAIVLSVPESHKTQNYPLKHKPGWKTSTGGTNRRGRGGRPDLTCSFLPSSQQLVEHDSPGHFLVKCHSYFSQCIFSAPTCHVMINSYDKNGLNMGPKSKIIGSLLKYLVVRKWKHLAYWLSWQSSGKELMATQWNLEFMTKRRGDLV